MHPRRGPRRDRSKRTATNRRTPETSRCSPDADRPGQSAQNAGKRLLDLLRQLARPGLLCLWHGKPDCVAGPESRLGHVAAVAALDLPEPAHQVDARADRAPVEVIRPARVGLAAGADQHLPVVADAAQPRARTAVGIDLPGATAITRHVPSVRPGLALAELSERVLVR